MKSIDIKYFMASAKVLRYTNGPFTQVRILQFNRVKFEVHYKTSYLEKEVANIFESKRETKTSRSFIIPKVKVAKKTALSIEKKSDITSMMKFMPLQDQEYYKTLGC